MLRGPKTSLVVAQQIVRDTARKGLKTGDLLPPEKAMLEEYQIGRGTLREGLRLLEFQGMIALKPGPKGGPVLLDPDASQLASTIILLMQLQNASLRTIVEARTALEPVICRLAAERISDEKLGELEANVDRMQQSFDTTDIDTFLETNKEFHDIIAFSTGNALFGYLTDALMRITGGTVMGVDHPAALRETTLKAHTNIYRALSEHNADLSEERMRDHINEYVRYAEKKFPELLGQVLPWNQAIGG
ncbi:FadR/GntR family transcriptional regulator [Aldersonia kunmingensis]|uniref:FadR/GntR family transcriptional regulator n=1 Tax=Aldersonia kunmingensis TaxID=408066 RepID=UPI000835482B|nr:FCD domain-containing protein [Aldersonia kunmingensis]